MLLRVKVTRIQRFQSWQPDLGSEVGFLNRSRPENENPDRADVWGFLLSAPCLLRQSLRFASPTMTTIKPARVQKSSFSGDRLQATQFRTPEPMRPDLQRFVRAVQITSRPY